ncbi:thioredoxin [Alteromonas gracilis]
MANLTAITDDDFETQVLKADKPVVVDFWAEWCGPCRQIAPVLDELAAENAEKITVVKMNVDEQPLTAAKYQVISLPTVGVFVGGELVKEIKGAKPKSAYLKEFADFI